ncbi:hypothetical protein ACFVZ3_42865 [Kitasatospora purpeofusca]|uniref:hypothetical protein n=1 Tax=Kitasatospora purpeofusca TaxID=67352 RepID=UPI0036845A81
MGWTPSGCAVGVAVFACSLPCSTVGGTAWAVGGRSGCWGALTAGPLPAPAEGAAGAAEGVAVGVAGAAAALGAAGAPPSAQA